MKLSKPSYTPFEFLEPSNEHVKVWRYMDFTKFVSLLSTSSLFFTRGDGFEDRFEGSLTSENARWLSFLNEHPELAGVDENYVKGTNKIWAMQKNIPKYVGINCWHINEHESAAMWGLYLKSTEGIAVQTTYAKLKKQFESDSNIHLGEVRYVDYEPGKEFIDISNAFSPLMHKRKSFEHEQELRILYFKVPKDTQDLLLESDPNRISGGVPKEVDLSGMVENIYVSPNAPAWLVELTKSVVNSYGYDFNVTSSDIGNDPIW